jgi:hypothetical protein
VEAGVAITALLAMTMLVIGGLRITSTSSDVAAAARSAARAAATAYHPSAGQAVALDTVRDVLGDRGVACQDLQVDTDGVWNPGGAVTVTVTCVVGLDDVLLAGFPGTRTVTGRGVEAIDVLRGSGT